MFAGVDWGGARHQLAIVDHDGVVVLNQRFGHDRSGIEGLLDAHSASGDVEVEFVGGEASIHTASGDVDIRHTDAAVKVQSASGDVDLGDAGGGPIRIKSVSGDVRVAVRAGRRVAVDVRTVSGEASSDIPLDGSAGEDAEAPLVEIQVNGVSGDVRIERATSEVGALES